MQNSSNAQRPTAEPEVRHRSGAVARMLRMPVATLRVWERRYGVTRPELSASGQRLYSAHDVQRLALLKQLTDLGHAIGGLARLDMQQLQRVASTHAGALAARAPEAPPQVQRPRLWRVAVVGSALATRVLRALARAGAAPAWELLGPYADVAGAAEALQADAADLLVMAEPRLHEGWWRAQQAAAPALGALRTAVVYRFAAEPTCAALAAAGVLLLRDPQSDAGLAQWLRACLPAPHPRAPELPTQAPDAPARRWDDAALADLAGLSSTIACECPRHVAELLMQLSHFEAYSAECRQRSRADAELHAFLQRVAGTARAMFESALERVARHEGILLPPSPAAAGARR